MSQTISVNGQSINYPETGDTNWGDEATDFAVQTSAALGKLGLASGTTVDIPSTLDVTGNTTLDANLSVGGNTTLGNGTSDTTAITGILNVDSGVLYVDPTNNKVGINDATPSVELDVNGAVAITGNETVGGTLNVTGDVAVNTNKFNVTASSGNTTIAGTLGVTGNTTLTGQALASDGTALLPGISFLSDSNTGLFRSASDQLDIVTGGDTRFRIESTGQIKAVYESQVGTDYNTQLDNGYLCRAWVNFNGTGTVAIRASGNVSSITDNGTGDYTVNFTTAMPDINYCFVFGAQDVGTTGFPTLSGSLNSNPTVSSLRIGVDRGNNSSGDIQTCNVAVFR